MWKRPEGADQGIERDIAAQPSQSSQPSQPARAVASAAPARPSIREAALPESTGVVNVGKAVVIKGELAGSEDVMIEGRFEGKILLQDHALTIGPNGRIKAELSAKSVFVLGQVTGNVTAADFVAIRESGTVEGDIIAPRVAIVEGAHFRGRVEMRSAAAPRVASSGAASAKAAPAASPAPRPVAAPKTRPAGQ